MLPKGPWCKWKFFLIEEQMQHGGRPYFQWKKRKNEMTTLAHFFSSALKLEETRKHWQLLIIFSVKRSNSAFHCYPFTYCRYIPVIFSKLKPSLSIYFRVRTESGYRAKGSNSALRLNLPCFKSDLNTTSIPPAEQRVSSKAQTPFSVWLPLVCVMNSCT